MIVSSYSPIFGQSIVITTDENKIQYNKYNEKKGKSVVCKRVDQIVQRCRNHTK